MEIRCVLTCECWKIEWMGLGIWFFNILLAKFKFDLMKHSKAI